MGITVKLSHFHLDKVYFIEFLVKKQTIWKKKLLKNSKNKIQKNFRKKTEFLGITVKLSHFHLDKVYFIEFLVKKQAIWKKKFAQKFEK